MRASPLALIVLGSSSYDAGSVPAGWQIKANHGTPEISLCKDDDTACVHLKSIKSSFALQRAVNINPAEMSYLTWRRKVSQLPAGGDFRRTRTDDQAAQVLVAFADRRVVTYIWDTTAPKGTMESTSSNLVPHVFAVVCQSGPAALNRWIDRKPQRGSRLRAGVWKASPACERHPPSNQFSAYRKQRRELFRRGRLPWHVAVRLSSRRRDWIDQQPDAPLRSPVPALCRPIVHCPDPGRATLAGLHPSVAAAD